ncbi:BadF/BadG/BcrA/BcrD ATPase family protein [Consotaella salsifontis]|nr:BadF/BadG/BcrA/BcrD ATPase family protein [Consotaella salsifontis]
MIGIDGGGTGCRAAVAGADGRVLGTGTAGAANIVTDLATSHTHIIEAAEAACRDAGLQPEKLAEMPAVLGLAGANVGGNGRLLEGMLPFARSAVVSDALTALVGALGPHDGAMAIIGTGSIFAARAEGAVRFVGGWGFKVGDLGGGARLGRALLEEALLAYDGIHPRSPLTQRVLAHFGNDPQAIVEFAHTARPLDFGTFAPWIIAAAGTSDPVAERLLDEGRRAVEEALAALMPAGCDRLCLLGGLSAAYAGLLSSRFGAILKQPFGDALHGALAIARERFGPGGANQP